jgi:AcrR family transcriptional regulator
MEGARVSTEKATTARRASGQQTRARILSAANAEFAEVGYQAATMARIAKRAGVATQTVYFNFRTKPLLLRELIFHAVAGGTEGQRPEDTDWFTGALAARDGAAALHTFATGAARILARASVPSETARIAAPTDAAVAEVYAEGERLRAEQFRRIIDSLAEHRQLRSDLSIDKATDIMLTMAGSQTYLQLTRERGWGHEEWAQWLSEALSRLLLDI